MIPLQSLRRATAVAGWIGLRGLRNPAVGLLAGLLLVLVPLQARLSPLGDVGVDPHWALARAWIVPVGLLGMAGALTLLGGARAFLELLPWPSRLLAEALGLLVGALGLQVPLVLGAALGAQGGPGAAPLLWLAADLQAATLALVLLRWKLHLAVRLGLFAGWLWVLPAVLPTGGLLVGGLRMLADVGGQPAGALSDAPGAWLARGAAVLCLALASTLLAAFPHRATAIDPR